MQDKVTAAQVLELVAAVDDASAQRFLQRLRSAVEALDDNSLDISWLAVGDALHRIYSVRRRHLAGRGIDVRGLDALLAAVQGSADGTKIGSFVAPTGEVNVVGFTDQELRSLLGWVIVPRAEPAL